MNLPRKTIADDNGLPLVIVNPKSAGGSTRAKWSALASDLRTHFGPFAAAFTKAPGDGIRIAESAALNGRKLIIACGGDGTLNEVANGILRSGRPAELGILPSGTGGDFRRTIKMPAEPREAARALRLGRTATIDVGRVSYTDHTGNIADRFFLNVSSFGIAASILKRVKGSGSLSWLPIDSVRGRASFALSTLQEIAGLERIIVHVSIDGEPERPVATSNFCIANARYFGGGMKIAPEAKLADGKLDVVNIGDIRASKIIMNAHSLYLGTHTSLDEVSHRVAARVDARPQNGESIKIEADGELIGRLPATYEIVPSALRIRVPAGALRRF